MVSRGPVAIVTGGAQGIGYAICDYLLQEGYRVCLTDVNEKKMEESVAELGQKHSMHKLTYVVCDVASEASFQETFSKVKKAFGRVDVLVNNAGIADEFNPDRTVAVNLMGPIIGSQLALNFMGKSNGGRGGIVINVSSIAGLVSEANIPVYSATKHAVVGLTRSYGSQSHFQKNGVTFMAICPFFVNTPLLQTSQTLKLCPVPGISKAIQPEFVAEGVIKLLREKRNGSTLIAMPAQLEYIELPEKLQKILS